MVMLLVVPLVLAGPYFGAGARGHPTGAGPNVAKTRWPANWIGRPRIIATQLIATTVGARNGGGGAPAGRH